MSKNKSVTFIGEGSSDVRLFPTTPSRLPYKPPGAPWPFARLTVSKEEVRLDCSFFQPVHQSVKPSDVTISLGKLWDVYFRTANKSNGFRFTSTSISRMRDSLREFGYHLDGSWERNMRIARFSVWTSLTYLLSIVLVVLVIFLKQTRVI